MAGEGRRRRIAAGGASRRDVLALTAIIGFGWAAGGQRAIAQPASARPKEGDLLVSAENEIVLAPADVPFGGPPLLAWPMDAADKTVRKESRLNKILLLRLDPATLVGATKERAAEGVVAYSAICPHTACQVDGWMVDQQILECSCHYSHYNPREGAAVIDDPTPRPLPALPLKVVDGTLAVAKPFTSRVGIIPS